MVRAGGVHQKDVFSRRLQLAHRVTEAHFPFVVAAKGAVSARNQYRPGRWAEELFQQVPRGRTGRSVVQPDIRQSATGRQVADQGDGGYAELDQAVDTADDFDGVRGFDDHSVRAAFRDSVQRCGQFIGRGGLGEVKTGSQDGRVQAGKLGL